MARDLDRGSGPLPVRAAGDGSQLRVRVLPKSVRPGIRGVLGERLKIAVQEPAEQGKANRAVCALLARALGVPAGAVTVVAGFVAQEKIVEIRGLAPDACRERLRALLEALPGERKR
jgi:uncharacterized protein (TIGR00251 family)